MHFIFYKLTLKQSRFHYTWASKGLGVRCIDSGIRRKPLWFMFLLSNQFMRMSRSFQSPIHMPSKWTIVNFLFIVHLRFLDLGIFILVLSLYLLPLGSYLQNSMHVKAKPSLYIASSHSSQISSTRNSPLIYCTLQLCYSLNPKSNIPLSSP